MQMRHIAAVTPSRQRQPGGKECGVAGRQKLPCLVGFGAGKRFMPCVEIVVHGGFLWLHIAVLYAA